tara:strand:+ start:686 stop:1561 length:876 start_codon:yes stop_codon:yes gene_type:complete
MIKDDNYKLIESKFRKIQKNIFNKFINIDKKSKNKKINWKHKSGGGGTSVEIYGGKIIEKAAVNFSSIHGEIIPNSALAKKIGKHKRFHATGVSVVVHSQNPFIPCSHLNIRYFDLSKNKWWFGGGYDLTPYFPYSDDVKLWHNNIKKMCDRHDKKYYKNFKNQCDEYFYIKHRKEKRGVGGIFFDNLNTKSKNHYILFLEDAVNTFLESYTKIINKRSNKKYNKTHKEFQLYRRGRYVEFNLIYDRGTLFGLQSNGRAESILMSMPPNVKWSTTKSKSLINYEKKLLRFL